MKTSMLTTRFDLNFRAASILLAIGLLLTTFFAHAASNQLSTIRVGQQADQTRVVFDLNKLPKYKLQKLGNPNRVIVDFVDTASRISFSKKYLKDNRLFSIQVGTTAKNTRVVLKLHKSLKVKYFSLAKNANGYERLVVDLKELPAELPAQAEKPKRSVIKTQTKPVQPRQRLTEKPVQKPVNQSVKKSTASHSQQVHESGNVTISQNKTDIVEVADRSMTLEQFLKGQAPRHSELVVAIDAGHGGKDTGAIGANGVYEKEITLQMAKRLHKMINQQPGMRAELIRDKDEFISLKKRVKIAKQKKADLFISIHADAFHDHRVRGGSVYVLSEKGASSTMAKLLAKSENASLQQVSLEEMDNDVVYALSDMSREANVRVSRKLAKDVLFSMQKRVKMHKHSVQSANFAVLKTIDMPSLLVETAFISNPYEAKKLQDLKFQERMASAIVDGVKTFVANYADKPRWGEQLYVRYRVKSGDTLSEIAEHYKVPVRELKRLNHIQNSNQLYIGKLMKIPVSERLLAGA